MCKCGLDGSTPFCDEPDCEWPDDVDDSNIAITEFLSGARILALYGIMPFREYLDLCVQFDPNEPEEDWDYADEDEDGGI
jgi:hypothetical protein